MPLSFKNYKRLWSAIALAYFCTGYLVCNWIGSGRGRYFDVELPFESGLPFAPLSVLGYPITYFCMLGIYFIVTDKNLFTKFLKAFFALTTLHYILFILLPVQMTLRPDITQESGMIYKVVGFFYRLDLPFNCFPSLHIAYTLLGMLLLWNYRRNWAYLYLLALIVVSVSVVLVKQHYVLDVIGGYLTASIVYIMCIRTMCRAGG